MALVGAVLTSGVDWQVEVIHTFALNAEHMSALLIFEVHSRTHNYHSHFRDFDMGIEYYALDGLLSWREPTGLSFAVTRGF